VSTHPSDALKQGYICRVIFNVHDLHNMVVGRVPLPS
jgi:hypothetical protein